MSNTYRKAAPFGPTLEIDFQSWVEGELKRLVLLFTHWVQASGVSVAPSKPHGYWRWLDHTITYLNFKKEMWAFMTRSLWRIDVQSGAFRNNTGRNPHSYVANLLSAPLANNSCTSDYE